MTWEREASNEFNVTTLNYDTAAVVPLLSVTETTLLRMRRSRLW